MVLALNFDEIMQACKEHYRPFTGDVPYIRKPRDLIRSIAAAAGDGRRPVIAEIKPASPTAGQIRQVDDPAELARDYEASGACGISVLTEPRYFRGSLEHLATAACVNVPVLRKDFLFDVAQVRESYFYGADSLLLISSFFHDDSLAHMIAACRDYSIEPLVEVHDLADIERSRAAGARLYAINNRDRHTLQVDRSRTARLAKHIDGVTVSASGISTVAQLDEALRYCDAALVGSALMSAREPGEMLKTLVYGGQ
ncbi:MAG: Indole-3-glycerol phosphate synthase [Methanocella sp. PtaU1.Bin125]|nr:MAG: Indole-3-glycerol phosphate synthase [Methanocella sp. PtaU1.Bin125]